MDFKFINGFIQWCFHPSITKIQRWITAIFFGALLAGGIFLWGYFLNWGNISFTYEDWNVITGPRLAFLRDAMQKGVLPLHISDPITLQAPTDRFLSVPTTFMGPTVILLRFLTIQHFILVQTILMFLLGFTGLLVLRKQLNLSPFAFTILFLLFNFNGHFLSHLSVGHFEWTNCFLLSWFAAFVIELLQKKQVGWAWVTQMTLLMFLIFLQGAYHFFLYCLAFLLILAIFSPKYFLTVLKTILTCAAISAVRIAPALLETGQLKVYYLGGYPMASDLWDALVAPTFPGVYSTLNGVNTSMGYWEYTIYIGLIGALFLIFFGIYRTYRRQRSISIGQDLQQTITVTQGSLFCPLLLPCLVFTVFSLSAVFGELRTLLQIPPFTGERVASRQFIITVLFLIILAVYELQKWLDTTHITNLVAISILLLLGIEFNDLYQNYQFWEVSYAVTKFSPQARFKLGHWIVANHPDAPYERRLILGLIVTCLTTAALACLTVLEKRRGFKNSRRNNSLQDLSIPL
ncbi:MAG TPA: hypothetical protein VKF38_01345 [Anaerolineaceae bacterium]|nr:hypothetical protein [Anaerolineaceae bacterium]